MLTNSAPPPKCSAPHGLWAATLDDIVTFLANNKVKSKNQSKLIEEDSTATRGCLRLNEMLLVYLALL